MNTEPERDDDETARYAERVSVFRSMNAALEKALKYAEQESLQWKHLKKSEAKMSEKNKLSSNQLQYVIVHLSNFDDAKL